MKKEKIINAYMTFRNGEPLHCSSLFTKSYDIYLEKAPVWQVGDKSVKVKIIYK